MVEIIISTVCFIILPVIIVWMMNTFTYPDDDINNRNLYKITPQEDITAYELAVMYSMSGEYCEDIIEAYPCTRRHFTLVKGILTENNTQM